MRKDYLIQVTDKQKDFLGHYVIEYLSDDYDPFECVRIRCNDGRIYESPIPGYGPQVLDLNIYEKMFDKVLEKVNKDMEKQNENI